MFDFAIITAPAARRRLTTNASLPVIMPLRDREPAVVGISIVSKLSLTITGTQCSAPTGPDWRKRRSRSSAASSACGLTMTIALSAAPCLSSASIRLRYCSTSERQVSEPVRNAAWMSAIVVSSRVNGACGCAARTAAMRTLMVEAAAMRMRRSVGEGGSGT
jgi:hypothetical protein